MKKRFFAAALAAAALSVGVLAGCTTQSVGISSIEKTSSVGLTDYYTITFTDGTTSQFTVTNGKDGADAPAVTATEVYETYKTLYGDDLTYGQFCEKFISSEAKNTAALNSLLRSTLKVYAVFSERKSIYGQYYGPAYPALYGGSAVVYSMGEEYTYILTNYHVVYDNKAVSSKISTEISAYLYGSESEPTLNSSETAYTYDDYAIPCEYVGGAISYDVAVLRAKTEDILEVNPQVVPVTVNTSFSVGDNTYAVGNPDDGGMSVTEGIVSVDSEFIVLNMDGKYRQYRSIRTDTAITHGSSGGGLFNMRGELIGLNNAGDSEITSMNYAIPATILTGVADGVIHYSNLSGAKFTKKAVFAELSTSNSRYVYDEAAGTGSIREQVEISSLTSGGIAEAVGLEVGDVITAVTLNGTGYDIGRDFNLTDLLLKVREGDKIKVGYKRGGEAAQTGEYTVLSSNLETVE